jgi:hypothetical protein
MKLATTPSLLCGNACLRRSRLALRVVRLASGLHVRLRCWPVSIKKQEAATVTKKLTVAEKYRQLKAQTESAGMKVEEVDGKIVVRRKPKKKTS